MNVTRKTVDKLATYAGVVITAFLIVAGALLTWGYTFTDSQVSSQLSAQKIVFPTADSKSFQALPTADQGAMAPYAGLDLTTGQQAKVYADNYIAVHLNEMAGGKTYSQLSTEARANPDDAKLQGQVATAFKGTTLRGMLLNAYAFWVMGQIALTAAIAAYVSAFLMFILTVLGFRHARKADG